MWAPTLYGVSPLRWQSIITSVYILKKSGVYNNIEKMLTFTFIMRHAEFNMTNQTFKCHHMMQQEAEQEAGTLMQE